MLRDKAIHHGLGGRKVDRVHLQPGRGGVADRPLVGEGEAAFVEQAKLVRRYGAAVVVMAFDEQGQADTYQRKVEICSRAYQVLTEQVGLAPQDIIFDPNIIISTWFTNHSTFCTGLSCCWF